MLTTSTASGGGWDVSWRQCTNSGNTEGLPGSPTIGIIGVNAGRPFTTNPCLKSELEWAGSAAQVYVNTNNPGPASARWPTTAQTSPEQCVLTKPNGTTETPSCAYDYGWNAAQSAYTTLTNALVGQSKQPSSLEWWLDVESANTWLPSTTLNTASIDGTIAYLDAQHVRSVGIYANQNDAHTIFTAASTFPAGTLSWLSTGETTLVGGLSYCNHPGFTHNGVALVQYLPSSPALDADARCVGYISGPLNPLASVAATGLTVNLLRPAPVGGVRLTLSSSSSAGRFSSTGPAGASSKTALAITIPATKSTATFSYWDTRAGYPGITARGALGRIANIATIVPGPVSSLSISPGSLTLPAGAAHALTVTGDDKWGNAIVAPLSPTWTVTPSGAATLSRGPAGRVTLRGLATGTVTVTATLGSLVTHQILEIVPPPGGGTGTIPGVGRAVDRAA